MNRNLFQNPFKPLQFVAIGREPEFGVEPLVRGDDAALVAEGLETGAAVIGPHAAVADTSEGKVAVGNLHDGIVDAGTSR